MFKSLLLLVAITSSSNFLSAAHDPKVSGLVTGAGAGAAAGASAVDRASIAGFANIDLLTSSSSAQLVFRDDERHDRYKVVYEVVALDVHGMFPAHKVHINTAGAGWTTTPIHHQSFRVCNARECEMLRARTVSHPSVNTLFARFDMIVARMAAARRSTATDTNLSEPTEA